MSTPDPTLLDQLHNRPDETQYYYDYHYYYNHQASLPQQRLSRDPRHMIRSVLSPRNGYCSQLVAFLRRIGGQVEAIVDGTQKHYVRKTRCTKTSHTMCVDVI